MTYCIVAGDALRVRCLQYKGTPTTRPRWVQLKIHSSHCFEASARHTSVTSQGWPLRERQKENPNAKPINKPNNTHADTVKPSFFHHSISGGIGRRGTLDESIE